MARRTDPDPLLLQTVSERLARLLAEDGPRRSADAAPPGPAELAAPVEELPDPPRFGRAHLGVVAAVLVLGVLVGGWSLLRARPVALAAPSGGGPSALVTEAAAATPPPGASPRAPEGTPGATTTLVVHVLGAVRHPGLVRLPAPARVQDAIAAAGGVTGAADPADLNLAQLLEDGQQVRIGTRDDPDGEVRGGPGGSSTGATGGTGGRAGALVDLNAADAAGLEALPGVGPVTASKILAWREQHGRFARVEELQEVDGIGPKTYAEIAPHVRV